MNNLKVNYIKGQNLIPYTCIRLVHFKSFFLKTLKMLICELVLTTGLMGLRADAGLPTSSDFLWKFVTFSKKIKKIKFFKNQFVII